MPYPARGWRLHAAVAARGAVISELPPGAGAHRGASSRATASSRRSAAATVVVQATERSGSLTTADFAAEVGRAVGAVPGQVTSRLPAARTADPGGRAADPRRDRRLDLLAGATGRVFAEPRAAPPPASRRRSPRLLDAVEDGAGTLGELAATPEEARAALAGLGELERLGLVRRGFAGRWERAA